MVGAWFMLLARWENISYPVRISVAVLMRQCALRKEVSKFQQQGFSLIGDDRWIDRQTD